MHILLQVLLSSFRALCIIWVLYFKYSKTAKWKVLF